MDNREEKWGTKDQGIPVISPWEACREFVNPAYVVANAVSYEEMKKQLLGLGICEGDIIICPDYEFILNQIVPSPKTV